MVYVYDYCIQSWEAAAAFGGSCLTHCRCNAPGQSGPDCTLKLCMQFSGCNRTTNMELLPCSCKASKMVPLGTIQ